MKYADLTIGSINQHFGTKVPALIQGPIDRYESLADQLFSEHVFDYRRFTFGAQRMLWGYIKKLVNADRIAVIVNEVLGYYSEKGYVGFIVLFAMALCSFQIYADFSGSMDIVIELSEIFGISLTENFRRPFLPPVLLNTGGSGILPSVRGCGRTYSIHCHCPQRLTNWGGNARNILGDRLGKLIGPSIALFITFFLVGMWHGTGWKYVLYGLYVALLVSTRTLLENVYTKARTILKIDETQKSWYFFRACVHFFMTIGWYMVIAKDVPDLFNGLRTAFTHFNPWFFRRIILYAGAGQT